MSNHHHVWYFKAPLCEFENYESIRNFLLVQDETRLSQCEQEAFCYICGPVLIWDMFL